MVNPLAYQIEELRREELLLLKSRTDLDEGGKRLRDQLERVTSLKDAGHDARQAERLGVVLRETLTEWERHHVLIEQRIDHLRKLVHPVPPALDGPL